MKKWLIVLCIITCMAGLTACGRQEADGTDIMPSEAALQEANGWAQVIDEVTVKHQEKDFIAYYSQGSWDAAMLEGAVESWQGSAEEMGNYLGLGEIIDNTMTCEEYEGIYYPIEGTISAAVKGSKHDAIIEIVYENGIPVSVSTNINYTFGESMGRAALNTLLGMGTVFSVLVLISLIIAAFGLIPKLTESKKQPEEKKADSIVEQIAEREELSDDTELVAVIAAAIAAYEGSGSTDGFVVRSIRKARNNRWQNA